MLNLFKRNKGDNQNGSSVDRTHKAIKEVNSWLKSNAERIYNLSLQDGADIEKVDELEALIQKDLPNDFKALYQIHNGLTEEKNMGNYFYGMDLYSIEQIINQQNSILFDKGHPSLERRSKEIKGTVAEKNEWIQFGSDGSRTSLFIDLSPSNDGTYGQIILIDGDYNAGIFVAKSMADLLENFSSDLNNSLYSLHEDALEDGQHFLEVNKSIDLLNWYNSERWKDFDTK